MIENLKGWTRHRIQINTEATFQRLSYLNCTPLSIHRIIEPPDGEENGKEGMWIQGTDRPILLLYSKMTLMPGIVKSIPRMKRTKIINNTVKFTRTK